MQDRGQQARAALADLSNLGSAAAAAGDQRCGSKPAAAAAAAARVCITPSGFHGAEAKQQLAALAASLGAGYSGALVQGLTTHLVCKRVLDCFGEAGQRRLACDRHRHRRR